MGMASAEQFYVYGDGRWRAVDARTGRVEGWGRARFAVARGGRLHSARAAPLLAALRALAAGEPSAAAPGPALPTKYPAQRRAGREGWAARCAHCQCCHHNKNVGSSCESKTDKKVTVAIQCDSPTTPPPSQAHTRKRKRDSTSSENLHKIPKRKRDSTSSEDLFREVTTIATVHSPRKPEPRRSNSKSPKKSVKRKRASSSSDSVKPQAHPSSRLRRPGPVKRKRSSSKESSVILTSRTKQRQKLSKYLRPKSKRDINISSEERPFRITRQNVSLVISSDDSDFESPPAKVKLLKRPKSSSTDVPLNSLKKAMTVSSIDKLVNHKGGSKRTTDKLVNHKIDPKRAINRLTTDDSIKHKIGLDSTTKRASTDEPIKHVLCPERTLFSRPAEPKTQDSENQIRSQEGTSKELLIDEKDVEILRLFIKKHYPDEELLRFDTDDEYKMIHFYHINPLVNVERCPRIARMIRAESQDSITLVDFASKLGLRSVSETSSKPKRYKTRSRLETSYIDSHNDTEADRTDAENKENRQTDKTRARSNKNVAAKKVLRESLNKPKGRDQTRQQSNNKSERDLKQGASETRERDKLRSDSETIENAKDRVQENSNKRDDNSKIKEKDKNIQRDNLRRGRTKGIDKKKDIDNTMDTVELSSESETEVRSNGSKKLEVQKPLLKKPKAKAVSMKRPGLKEYSNLEDHAIVSWVSNGGRANQVNGNRLWRQLQEQFHRLTGHGRTWHSLRNRYLRYILPRLSALALPPPLQARLRAAAATGELKARKKEQRRNSIFTLPARGASSRLPRAPRAQGGAAGDTDHDADASPPRVPRAAPARYSDVTRQFADRHRAMQNSSERSTDSSRQRHAIKSASERTETSPGPSSRKSSGRNSPGRRGSRGRKKMPPRSNESSGRSSDRRGSVGRVSNNRSSDSSDENESGASPERLSTRKSIRLNTPREARRQSTKRNYTPRRDDDEDESNRRGSLRDGSSASNRHKTSNSPSELKTRRYKRISNRLNSSSRESSSGSDGRESPRSKPPSESKTRQSRISPTSPRRKSNRRKSNASDGARSKLLESSPKINGRTSPNDSITQRRKSNRRKSPAPSKRVSPRRAGRGADNPLRSGNNTRRLFNPKAVLL